MIARLILLLSMTMSAMLSSTDVSKRMCTAVDSKSTVYDERCADNATFFVNFCNKGGAMCRYCFEDDQSDCNHTDVFNDDLEMKRNVLLDGDMLLKNQSIEDFLKEREMKKNTMSNAIRDINRRWTNGVVPYRIDSSFDAREREVINAALQEWMKRVECIEFVKKSVEKNYIRFVKSSGCFSSVGMWGGEQYVSLGEGCVYKGIVMHEVMHALGFFHEQSRYDRDAYVTINWENIQSGVESNFMKFTEKEIDHLSQPYDYESIMHYDTYAFSSNGQPTIVRNDGGVIHGSYDRETPSDVDVKKMKIIYCTSVKTTTTTTTTSETTTTSTSPPIDASICDVDAHPLCQGWTRAGYCNLAGPFMKFACRRSCDKDCRRDQACDDYDVVLCKMWASSVKCNEFTTYVCPKTCKQC